MCVRNTPKKKPIANPKRREEERIRRRERLRKRMTGIAIDATRDAHGEMRRQLRSRKETSPANSVTTGIPSSMRLKR